MSELHLPLHLLTKEQTKLWLKSRVLRRIIAQELLRRYPFGCHVLAWNGLRHFCNVDPQGNIHELLPPWRQYHRSQIANKPPVTECACADCHHPEYGQWRHHPDYARGRHHPFCEFDQTSSTVYREVFLLATGGQTEYDPQIGKVRHIELRPDEYDRARERAEGKRQEKTGPRVAGGPVGGKIQ